MTQYFSLAWIMKPSAENNKIYTSVGDFTSSFHFLYCYSEVKLHRTESSEMVRLTTDLSSRLGPL